MFHRSIYVAQVLDRVSCTRQIRSPCDIKCSLLRLREGGNINKSLMMLGQVIQKLSSGGSAQFINYRDSKLTRLLQVNTRLIFTPIWRISKRCLAACRLWPVILDPVCVLLG